MNQFSSRRRTESAPLPSSRQLQELRKKIIGMGEKSFRKSYYPDLQRRLRELETEATERKAAYSLLKIFLATAAHEFRTPITTIQMLLELLERNPPSSEGALRKLLKKMKWPVSRLTRMVNELLDVSYLESGRLILKPEECDGIALVKQVIHDFSSHHPEKEVQLKCHQKHDPFKIHLDPSRFQEVLENLLDNSWKYSAPGTPIQVSAHEKHNVFRVAICDFSPGIPKEKRKNILDLYNHSSNIHSFTYSSGLGLGLPISSQIVQLHGGSLKVWSRLGLGSIFIIRLPT